MDKFEVGQEVFSGSYECPACGASRGIQRSAYRDKQSGMLTVQVTACEQCLATPSAIPFHYQEVAKFMGRRQ